MDVIGCAVVGLEEIGARLGLLLDWIVGLDVGARVIGLEVG